jgi:hypothetical protein
MRAGYQAETLANTNKTTLHYKQRDRSVSFRRRQNTRRHLGKCFTDFTKRQTAMSLTAPRDTEVSCDSKVF